eukprot:1010642-Prorocentrum_minimum.AAC.1
MRRRLTRATACPAPPRPPADPAPQVEERDWRCTCQLRLVLLPAAALQLPPCKLHTLAGGRDSTSMLGSTDPRATDDSDQCPAPRADYLSDDDDDEEMETETTAAAAAAEAVPEGALGTPSAHPPDPLRPPSAEA